MPAHAPELNALSIPSEHQAQYDECVKIAQALEGIRRARANSGKVIDAVSDIEGFLKLNWTQITLKSLSQISGRIQSILTRLRRGERSSITEIVQALPSSKELFNLLKEEPAQEMNHILLPRSTLDQALSEVYPKASHSNGYRKMREDIEGHPQLYERWLGLLLSKQLEIVEKLDQLAENLKLRQQKQRARKDDRGKVKKHKSKPEPLPAVGILTPDQLLGDAASVESQNAARARLKTLLEADMIPSPFDVKLEASNSLQFPAQWQSSSLRNPLDPRKARDPRPSPPPNDAFHAISRNTLDPSRNAPAFTPSRYGTDPFSAHVAQPHSPGYPPFSQPEVQHDYISIPHEITPSEIVPPRFNGQFEPSGEPRPPFPSGELVSNNPNDFRYDPGMYYSTGYPPQDYSPHHHNPHSRY